MPEVRKRLNERDRAKHLQMVKNPDDWPIWPILPLKRYFKGENTPQMGYIRDGKGPVVNLGMIYHVKTRPPDKVMTYESWEALIDDGWEVD